MTKRRDRTKKIWFETTNTYSTQTVSQPYEREDVDFENENAKRDKRDAASEY